MACIPVIAFGVSFVISFDFHNLKWTKTSRMLKLIRLVMGLTIAIFIDLIFKQMNSDIRNHTSVYTFHYLFPAMMSTFFIFGIMPHISELIGISRTRFNK
jgi:hypothetical protein